LIETVRRTVDLDPFAVDEDYTDVLTQLIVAQSDEIECDDIATVETIVLDARTDGLSSHANILIDTDHTETTHE